MDWIKVTPETMPPDKVIGLAIIKSPKGKAEYLPGTIYDHEKICWMFYDFIEDLDFCKLHHDFTVTHWTPYPPIPEED